MVLDSFNILAFIVFPYRTLIENSVSHQMTYLAKTYNTQFQLGLGDNFYFKGVQNAEDPRFEVSSLFCIKF